MSPRVPAAGDAAGTPRGENGGARAERALLGAVLLAGAAARVAGLWTDFWLDEIWNLNIARSFGYADLLLRVPYDANHILNSLWLRAVGAREAWAVYRLPALAAGLATVAAAWRAGARWGAREGGLAAGLSSASLLLILYSSEARGHAPMVAFAFAAFLCLDRWLRDRSRAAYAGWAASVALGLLSHLMFVQAYAALAAWSAWGLRRGRGPGRAAQAWFVLHLPCAAALLFVYWVQVRAMGHAGGPPLPTLGVLRATLGAALGGPDSAWAWAVGAAGLTAAAWAVRDLARQGDDEWVFFAGIVFAAPAALLALHPPGLLFPRYFLLAVAFAIPLWARAAAAALRARRLAAGLAALALAAYGVGNGARVAGFLRDGRGHYLEALRYMSEETAGTEVTVGSGHDVANRMIVDFYAGRVPGKGFVYVARDRWTADAPEWVIRHEEVHDPAPQAELTALNGSRYRYARAFRYSEQAGWDWYLYRRERP